MCFASRCCVREERLFHLVQTSWNDLKCLFSNSQHSPRFCLYFLRITNSLLPITLSRKPAFCVCVAGLCPTLLLTGLWFMYSVISAALPSWQGRLCIAHTPDCGNPHWIPGVSLNPNVCGYLPVSPPFFLLLPFSLPPSLLFHSLFPPHFFNPFFPLCLPFFLNFCIFFSLQENVLI